MGVAAAALLSSFALIAPGDRATASLHGGTLSVSLHYLMTCGQPGPGPLRVRLPAGWRLAHLHATVRAATRPATRSRSTVTIALPKPPPVTCMSIAEGTLPVTIATIRASAGAFVVHAAIGTHTFAPHVRVP